MSQRPSKTPFETLASTGAAACGAQQGGDPGVVSSDPELAKVAATLLPSLAERSGLALREPVRLERRSRGQLMSYLEAKLDEELPPEEERAMVDTYALLGLVPPDLDLRELLLKLYTEQIAGFMAEKLTPQGVMVVIEARHLCVEMRGVKKPGALTVTSAIRGIFNTKPVREEFLDLLNRRG